MEHQGEIEHKFTYEIDRGREFLESFDRFMLDLAKRNEGYYEEQHRILYHEVKDYEKEVNEKLFELKTDLDARTLKLSKLGLKYGRALKDLEDMTKERDDLLGKLREIHKQ